MKDEYDFSKGVRGVVTPLEGKKTRITIRIDSDILDWFKKKVENQGGGNYQTMLNNALRLHIQQGEQSLEETLRKVVREELRATH